MKVKFMVIVLFLLVLYMLLPLTGVSVSDVSIFNSDSKRSQFPNYTKSREEFVEEAKSSVTNPESTFIVHPVTAVSRDGREAPNGLMYLTSGWIRSGNYKTGKVHGGLDSDVGGYYDINSCPCGDPDCDDVALIAPVSGTITQIINNAGHEKEYYEDGVHTSMVVIQPTGQFKGWTFRVLHLSSIPSTLKVGDQIKQGDYIGFQCSQGSSTASHVHLDVKSGDVKVPITQWLPYLTTHSSIKKVEDYTGVQARLALQGWEDPDVKKLNENPKFESKVVIPDEFLIK